jgi:hypothetical protein
VIGFIQSIPDSKLIGLPLGRRTICETRNLRPDMQCVRHLFFALPRSPSLILPSANSTNPTLSARCRCGAAPRYLFRTKRSPCRAVNFACPGLLCCADVSIGICQYLLPDDLRKSAEAQPPGTSQQGVQNNNLGSSCSSGHRWTSSQPDGPQIR